jgi:Cof subfamily protein (haloacid dehalogenase superfamily)
MRTAKFPYRLVATDLDGTILRSDKSVSERTRKIVGQLEADGVSVVLVSARPPRVLKRIAERNGFNGLAICCNGAIIFDLESEEMLRHIPVSYEETLEVARLLQEAMPGLGFAWERGLEFGCDPRFASLHTFPGEEILNPVDILTLDESPFSKLIVLDPDNHPDMLLDVARRYAGPNVTITHSGAPFIEISAVGVDKASGLVALAEELSIPMSSVIAFGDMPNDLAMLESAGYSVGVANAHGSVLARVDEVTLSNDEDGVAVVLERLFYEGRGLRAP